MLDSLLELEVTYSLLTDPGEKDSEIDPLDIYYQKLHSDIEVVENKSDEFKLINQFIKNTHGATHSNFQIELMDVSYS